MYACERGHKECVEILLKHPSIDLNRVDGDGGTAFTIAFYMGTTVNQI